METKSHQIARLKAMRRKYGLGEFKNLKRKVFKSHSVRKRMAKRKRSSHKKSSFGVAGIWTTILGVGGYIIYEAIVRPMLPLGTLSNTALSLGEIAVGLWLSKKSGIIGNVAKAMVLINVYSLLRGFVLPLVSGVSTSSNSGIYAY